MGVPAFFRWLSRKYPSVIIECTEKKQVDEETGRNIYEDASLPNPNEIEFDNLYLDMNGIIHPCTHPEDKPPPKNEDEMMIAIFDCIDRLFSIVRPRKLLYMAIDGVAPRAKMNQQRSRRFRASKEAAEKAIEIERIREELRAKGAILPPEKPKEQHFDSNCITPGTPFMERLSRCLQYYIHDRLNNNPGWKNIKVILSDANVPGEGEHKLMDYIRKQRAQPDHDPNTQHVLCGADADLIMLGLATHEPNFTIIREEFLPNKPRPCELCQIIGHEMKDCTGLDADFQQQEQAFGKETQFIFVRLNVLKEYLERELAMPNLPFTYDFERVIDDWVFMCFFVGNDFLPHIPSLEIRENAIDRLITLYKKCVYKTGGYLTDSGDVALERVEIIMQDLGYAEDDIFRDRQKSEMKFRERNKRMKLEKQRRPNFSEINKSQFAPTALGRGITPAPIVNARDEIMRVRMLSMGMKVSDDPNAALNSMLHPSNDTQDGGRGTKRKHNEVEQSEKEEEDEQAHDEVRLWEEGFKDRYYESKFDVMPENVQFRYAVAQNYVKGLSWVLKYYYQGCASWEWYFPYHYAPFASDFLNIRGLSKEFEKGEPFKPLEQLMGVFPAASRQHVPEPFAKLMIDPHSPIIDFYPEDFQIDLNGKKFAWQGVALLPFVDEKRLFKACAPFVGELTLEEKKRNKLGDNFLYVGRGNSGYKTLKYFCESEEDNESKLPISIDGMQGLILLSDDNVEEDGTFISPIKGLHDCSENSVITVRFRDPEYPKDFIFPARKLTNATSPPRVLKQGSDNSNSNYRPNIGFNNNRSQFATMGDSGHRSIKHHTNNWNSSGNDNRQNYQNSGGKFQQQNQHQYQRGGYNSNNNNRGNGNNQQSKPWQQNDRGGQSRWNNSNSSNNNNSSGSNYTDYRRDIGASSGSDGGFKKWKYNHQRNPDQGGSQGGQYNNSRGGGGGGNSGRGGGYQRYNSERSGNTQHKRFN